jgi:hypothetical protein
MLVHPRGAIMDRTRPQLAAAALLTAALAAPGLLAAAGDATPPQPAAPAVAAPAAAVPTAPAPKDAYLQEIEAWRRERDEGLRDRDGWLTLVGLHWLKEGENRFGSGADNEIVFPAGRAPARAGTLRLAGDNVTLEAAPGAGITRDGKPVTTLALTSAEGGKPIIVELGSLRFFVIKRGDRLGLRVRDRESPALAAFRGVESFPADAAWRVEARFEPYDPPKPVPVPNILGMVEEEPSPGAVVFDKDGRTYRLDALPASDKGDLFLIFADRTSGEATYGGGRFLEAPPPAGGKVVVDFNKAYNPPCVFTEYATCPLPPRQNRLDLAVTAGEKMYGEQHHP